MANADSSVKSTNEANDLDNDDDSSSLGNIEMADADSSIDLSSGEEDAFGAFTRENGFPERSERYFVAEHSDQSGLKAIVKRAFLNRSERNLTHDNRISQEIVNFHLHQTQRYYNLPSSEIPNVCSMMAAARQQEVDRLEMQQDCYEQAIHDVLVRLLAQSSLSERDQKECLSSTLAEIESKKMSFFMIIQASPSICPKWLNRRMFVRN